MEKNCTLVKTIKKAKAKDGSEKTFTNFYLYFDNGVVIPVTTRNYPISDSMKESEAAIIKNRNHDNFVKFGILAVLKEDK